MEASSINNIVEQIIELLVEAKYDEIAAVTNSDRLSSNEIESAVGDYGRQLILPPSEAYSQLLDAVL